MVDADDVARLLAYAMLVTFGIGVILFSVSFDTLEPNQMGIRYDNNWKTIDDSRVYNNGRYFVGLGRKFIKFPTSCVSVLFRGQRGERAALSAWTAEGQSIQIDISFQYRLDRGYLIDIYRRYQSDYDTVYANMAIQEIKQTSILYETEDFFINRRQISDAMRDAIRAKFATEHVILEVFNMRALVLPSQFDDKIVAKVVQAQQAKTAENLRVTAIRRSNITVINGDAVAQKSTILATAAGTETRVMQSALTSRFELLRKQEAVSYAALQSALQLNDTGLLQYRLAQLMGDIRDNRIEGDGTTSALKFVVGFDSPIVSIK